MGLVPTTRTARTKTPRMIPVAALSAMLAYVHVFLNPADAASFAKRWRPQIAAGQLVSVTGIDQYTRACVALHSERCTGAVVQLPANNEPPCLYVLHRNRTVNTAGDVQVVSILRQKTTSMIPHMRALREWYGARSLNDIHGNNLPDATEREFWDLSGMDA